MSSFARPPRRTKAWRPRSRRPWRHQDDGSFRGRGSVIEGKLKSMARTRELTLGHFIVEFATPGIGYILKNAGCDYVLLDTEHSGFHHETIKSALRYFEAAG